LLELEKTKDIRIIITKLGKLYFRSKSY